MVESYSGKIETLTPKWQRIYRQRVLDNLVKHGLSAVDADSEARQFIAHELFIETQKRLAKEDQMKLFGTAPPTDRRRIA